MKGFLFWAIRLVAMSARLAGMRVRVAENLLVKRPLLVLGRTLPRAPNLLPFQRFVLTHL